MPGRRAKLVCTLGPATGTAEGVRALAQAGTDVFRINFSHGEPGEHETLARLVREAERDVGRSLAILTDLPGPKVRLGSLTSEPVHLRQGSRFVLRADDAAGDEEGASTTYAGLAGDLQAGDRVLLADGAVELEVRETRRGEVVTDVVRGGAVRSHQGVNVPADRLGLPAITSRDREALVRALELGADLIAQSFVRGPEDLIGLRALMGERAVPIVAKIETRPAVERIEEILREADAIMIARGDLGVELPMEEIPILQKELLLAARSAGRPAIVATQMLESMLRSPRPTRAEASDVANAVLDGADAIMLSGETAIGEHAVEAARVAERIAQVVEDRAGDFRALRLRCRHRDEASAVAHAAAEVAAGDPDVVAIACYTSTGRTAGLLSTERPGVPIVAFVPDEVVRRALCLRWGVVPLEAERPQDTDEMISLMIDGLQRSGLAAPGETVVMAASSPAGKSHTNMLKIHQVGQPVR